MSEKPYICNICGIESVRDLENEDSRCGVKELKYWNRIKELEKGLIDICNRGLKSGGHVSITTGTLRSIAKEALKGCPPTGEK